MGEAKSSPLDDPFEDPTDLAYQRIFQTKGQVDEGTLTRNWRLPLTDSTLAVLEIHTDILIQWPEA